MAILEIVTLENEVLRQKAKPVKKITKRTDKLISDMFQTMYKANGVGLAAPQVGVSERIIVIDIGDDEQIALINPEILERSSEQEIDVEGCLSIPGLTGKVCRAEKVVVKGLDRNRKWVKISASGLLARAFQHEIDHLDGIVFTDHLTEESVKE